MPYIDAALAFAITMLVVAMIVQQLIIFPLRPFRRQQLINSLRDFFSNHLEPVITKRVDDLAAQLGGQLDDAMRKDLQASQARLKQSQEHMAEMRKNLIAKLNRDMVAVPGVDHADRQANNQAKKPTEIGNSVTHQNLRGEAIIRVSADEIVGLIRRSNTGKEIEAALGDKADELFDELKVRYDEVRNVYRGFLRQNARLAAILVGTLFALAFNINTFTLLSVYISSDAARVAVIEQMGTIQAQVQADCTTEAAVNAPEGSPLFEKCSSIPSMQAQVSLLQNTMPMGWSDEDVQIFKLAFGAAEHRAKVEAKVLAGEAANVAVKLGWITPSSEPTVTSPETQAPQDALKQQVWNAIWYWLLGCLATGLLAGLGTPFWYDTVQRIATFRGKVLSTSARQERSGSQPGGQPTTQPNAPQTPTTP